MKNIDLLSAFNDLSTSDDVTSLITDEDNTLVDEPSAMEDSLIASEELQSALMLYNDSFPVGQETVIENGKKSIPFYVCPMYCQSDNWWRLRKIL